MSEVKDLQLLQRALPLDIKDITSGKAELNAAPILISPDEGEKINLYWGPYNSPQRTNKATINFPVQVLVQDRITTPVKAVKNGKGDIVSLYIRITEATAGPELTNTSGYVYRIVVKDKKGDDKQQWFNIELGD